MIPTRFIFVWKNKILPDEDWRCAFPMKYTLEHKKQGYSKVGVLCPCFYESCM